MAKELTLTINQLRALFSSGVWQGARDERQRWDNTDFADALVDAINEERDWNDRVDPKEIEKLVWEDKNG